jgi:hypothetical protein
MLGCMIVARELVDLQFVVIFVGFLLVAGIMGSLRRTGRLGLRGIALDAYADQGWNALEPSRQRAIDRAVRQGRAVDDPDLAALAVAYAGWVRTEIAHGQAIMRRRRWAGLAVLVAFLGFGLYRLGAGDQDGWLILACTVLLIAARTWSRRSLQRAGERAALALAANQDRLRKPEGGTG